MDVAHPMVEENVKTKSTGQNLETRVLTSPAGLEGRPRVLSYSLPRKDVERPRRYTGRCASRGKTRQACKKSEPSRHDEYEVEGCGWGNGGQRRGRLLPKSPTFPEAIGRPTAKAKSDRGRDRTGDLPLFRRTLVPTELPGRKAIDSRRRTSPMMATLTGLEPATSAVTGRRANQLRHRAIQKVETVFPQYSQRDSNPCCRRERAES